MDKRLSTETRDEERICESNIIVVVLIVMILSWSLAIYGIWSFVKLIFG